MRATRPCGQTLSASNRLQWTQWRPRRRSLSAAAANPLQNVIRALVVITPLALIPLHANVPSHFAYNPVVAIGHLSMVSTQNAVNDAFAALKAQFATPMTLPAAATAKPPAAAKPGMFQIEQSMTASQLIDRWNAFVAEASQRFHIPEAWIRAVIRMESGGRTMLGKNQPIMSRVGAIGLMQLMPETYWEMREANGLGANPADPHDNIMAGTAYLRWLHGKYGYPAMFAAYNAGPGKLEDHLSHGASLPAETIHYVSGIVGGLAAAALGGSHAVKHARLARLTKPNGRRVLIDGAKVASVRLPLPGEFAPGVRAIVKIGHKEQAVRETVVMAKAAIRASGGSV